jgi:hopanoid biosynthesis associated membrane protein HpnM
VEFTIEGYGVALDLDAELRMDEGDDEAALQEAERLRDAFFVLHRRLGDEAAPPDLDALEEDLFGDLSDLLDDLIESLPARTVTLDDLPEDLSQRYLSSDGRARVEVFAAGDLTEPGALEQFSDLIHSVRPDAGGPAAGTVAFGRAIVDSLQQALATALVVITILLLTLTRSFKDTLITLTPLGVGGIATAAVTVFADIPFNYANIIVLPLILGIGVDSGIHLVRRYRMGPRGARNLLSTSTASAVLFSALTTGASFATLALSHHLGISSLAQLLTIGVGLMLAANLTVLPSILTLVGVTRWVPLALVLICAPAASEELDPNGAATSVVESLHSVLLGCMKEGKALGFEGRFKRIVAELDQSFDLPLMARAAVTSSWKELTPEERTEFVALSRRLSASRYADNFSSWDDQRFETLSAGSAARKTILVKTQFVQPKDKDIRFDYRLRKTDEGWRLIDVQLEGKISELALRRGQYRSVIESDGFPELVKALEEQIDEISGD